MKTLLITSFLITSIMLIIVNHSFCQIKSSIKNTVLILQLPEETPLTNKQKVFIEKRITNTFENMGRFNYIRINLSSNINIEKALAISKKYSEEHQLQIARKQWKLYDSHYKEERITGEVLDLIVKCSYVIAPRVLSININNDILVLGCDVIGISPSDQGGGIKTIATITAKNEGNLMFVSKDKFTNLVEDALISLKKEISNLDIFKIYSDVKLTENKIIKVQKGRNLGIRIDDWYKIISYRKVGKHRIKEDMAFGQITEVIENESVFKVRWYSPLAKNLSQKNVYEGDQIVEIPKKNIDLCISMGMNQYSITNNTFERNDGAYWPMETQSEYVFPFTVQSKFHFKSLSRHSPTSNLYLTSGISIFFGSGSSPNGVKLSLIGIEKKFVLGRFEFGVNPNLGLHWLFTNLYSDNSAGDEGLWAESFTIGYEMLTNIDYLFSHKYSMSLRAGYQSFSFKKWKIKDNSTKEDVTSDFYNFPKVSVDGMIVGIGFNILY